ncbi:hypothetical protein [Lentilactobacillus parafarraginis]|uniref:hypothetical protein n=1 Tax=Lentilactobacillus parafarraginis TaxID=390842 RepID=UPI001CDD5DEA|nr:hypothetical protein [Lentilactobacillus parafarraginis]
MDRKDRVKLLSDLVKINTIGGREEATAKFLSHYLEGYGIHGKTIEVEGTVPCQVDTLNNKN